jgi:hypothetical protein
VPVYARHPLHHGCGFARRLLGKQRALNSRPGKTSVHAAIDQRVQAAYKAGYDFHHAAVAREPALLKWITRVDYWDYRLPGGAA